MTCISTLLATLVVAASAPAPAADDALLTRAERTAFTETSLYSDVVELVGTAASLSPKIRLTSLGTSAGGLDIPLVVASGPGVATPGEAQLYGLPAILLAANIHSGEVEGKEALQMLLREVVEGALDEELDNQVLLVVPIFNPDGNDQLGDNRGDDGPELAGVRHNAQNLDLNRDFMKLATPEVRALVRLVREWDPVLYVDMHTTNGSYHREPVTYTTLTNENGSEALEDYMWQRLFPAVAATLQERYGYQSVPYGNFVDRTDPAAGWANDAFEPRYSTNAVGLRDVFTILDENYSHADFRTRVLASHGFVRSLVSYMHEHIADMRRIQLDVRRRTRESFADRPWVTSFDVEPLEQVTIHGYELEIERIPEDRLDEYPAWLGGVLVKPTETLRDYTVPYLTRTVATATVDLPEAYLVPAPCEDAIRTLRAQGVLMERLTEPVTADVERYHLDSLETADRPYQGEVPLTLTGSWKREEAVLEEGSYLVPMRQPLARLVPVLLEPEAPDSLARWGFFTRWLVPQWGRDLDPYPVLRLPEIPDGARMRLGRD